MFVGVEKMKKTRTIRLKDIEVAEDAADVSGSEVPVADLLLLVISFVLYHVENYLETMKYVQ